MSVYPMPGAESILAVAPAKGFCGFEERASSISALIILPPGPVPLILARLTPAVFAAF